MRIWGEWKLRHIVFLTFLAGAMAGVGLVSLDQSLDRPLGPAAEAQTKKEKKEVLYLVQYADVRVFVDPETKCQYLILTGYREASITPRMERTGSATGYTQMGCT